jgi:glycosyltransferase involved in cell wall biosynthesis
VSLKLSILLPVRNEEENLAVMLRILRSAIDVPHEVVVITDTPDDRSIPVVKKVADKYPEVRHVANTKGRGVANAIRTGIDDARGEYILIFAADEVGPVIVVEKMIALADSGYDVVGLTRYSKGGRRLGGSLIQHILSRTANFIFGVLTPGFPLTDATSGCKLVRRSVFEKIVFEASPVGWTVAFEMSIKFYLLGLRMTELPSISIDRLYGGASSFRVGSWTWEYFRWFARGIRDIRAENRRRKQVKR